MRMNECGPNLQAAGAAPGATHGGSTRAGGKRDASTSSDDGEVDAADDEEQASDAPGGFAQPASACSAVVTGASRRGGPFALCLAGLALFARRRRVVRCAGVAH